MHRSTRISRCGIRVADGGTFYKHGFKLGCRLALALMMRLTWSSRLHSAV